MDEAGEITATIDNRRVAAARLELDAPTSAFFVNPDTGLRLDLLFDFPVAAAELAVRATPIKIRSHLFHVASARDLLKLKEMATASRTAPGDAEDLAYLQRLLRDS
jgi:hypothetical protein